MFEGLKKLLGDDTKAKLKPLYGAVERINALEEGLKGLSSEELKGKTAELKKRLRSHHPVAEDGDIPPQAGGEETLEDILPEAFALVREAGRRTLGERHFDVQLLGGQVLHNRGIAEMRTGEGKTLVATLPAYLNALEGKGVHVVTVNDYLSRRDAVWMGQIYHLLGLTVGIINHDSSFLYDPSHTSANQANGISNNQFPISKPTFPDVVLAKAGNQKELDSRLPARPSGAGGRGNDSQKGKDTLDVVRDELGSFKVVHEFLKPCSRREAYHADITYGTNNEFGFDYLRDNLEYSPENLRQRGYHYAIVDEIDSILIDEARTPLIISAPVAESEDLYGRFAEIARGLEAETDFTVDEKQKAVQLTPAGIEKAEKALGVDNIYTEKGIKYVHHLETATRAKALFHLDKEYVVKDGEIIIVDEFTGRLMPGRRWSEGLHQAVEAKEGVKVQKESRTFASITFQNYFRQYTKLAGMTGTAKTSSEEFYKVYGLDVVSIPTNKPINRADRNDQIFQTEIGKFKAIARKVAELNSAGQPVLIGTVSIEKNEVLSEYLRSVGVPHELLNAKNHEREGEIIAQAGRKGAVTVATNMAGRGVDIKLGGNPTNAELSEEVKKLGGLFVLGTERHEARRIDNQLRGRSGRQGDPGETQFFVSMEDSLMRVFASDTIKNMMGRFGIPEDEPIENRIITRSLESAQTKIEGFNFDSRKHVLEYDNVLNHQRSVIYERRRKILVGGPIEVDSYLALISAGNEGFLKTIEEKKKQLGGDFYPSVQRLILQTIDLFWVEHLEIMDYLRGSVNLRAYGQRDPLVEYKKEGLKTFKEMEENIIAQVMNVFPHVGGAPVMQEQIKLQEVHEQAQLIGSGDEESDSKHQGNIHRTQGDPKVGRNDACPCGSGKKYKKCHGK
ncbi:MAG: preprotein translocase subunit SecA [bacterium]|nr:preprotein translocase subunit SecA [bacterium]